jgi:hypothetical protein
MDFGGLNSSNGVIHIQDVIVKSCKLQIFCENSRWKPRASLRHTSPICRWPKIIDWKSRTCRTTEAKASTLAPQRPHSFAFQKAGDEFSKFLAGGIERHGLLVSIDSLFPLALTQGSWPKAWNTCICSQRMRKRTILESCLRLPIWRTREVIYT